MSPQAHILLFFSTVWAILLRDIEHTRMHTLTSSHIHTFVYNTWTCHFNVYAARVCVKITV